MQLIHVGRASGKYENTMWIELEYCGYPGNHSQNLFHGAFGTSRRCSVKVWIGLMDLGIANTSVSGINMLQWRELVIEELMALLKSVGFVPIIILKGSIRGKSCFKKRI